MNNACVTDEPIAAVATALAPAALGIIRVSGTDSICLLSHVFSRPTALQNATGNTVVYGWMQDISGKRIDEVLINVYRAPKSFTGEESAEIICHGGVNVVTSVYALLIANGFRAAERGEFSFRSFANGKTDLARAEAIREIISAKTDEARVKAAGRLAGNLTDEITTIKESIVAALAAIEVELDYPEDEATATAVFHDDMITGVRNRLEQLAATWNTEKLYQDGAKIVLCGRTNAGKSSVFNMMLKEDRAIVSDVQGTTRDWIESTISCGGIPIRLFDTAGIRETADSIEQIGLDRMRQLANDADVILYIVDSIAGIANEDIEFMQTVQSVPVIGIWNKIDDARSASVPQDADRTWIPVSTKTVDGLALITNAIAAVLKRNNSDASTIRSDSAAIGSLHQKDAVITASQKLAQAQADMKKGQPLDILAEDLMEAVQSLGEITGETLPDDILSKVFSEFCVGK